MITISHTCEYQTQDARKLGTIFLRSIVAQCWSAFAQPGTNPIGTAASLLPVEQLSSSYFAW